MKWLRYLLAGLFWVFATGSLIEGQYLYGFAGLGACKSNCVTAHASLLCTGGYHEQYNER